jgi:hypothetical protein
VEVSGELHIPVAVFLGEEFRVRTVREVRFGRFGEEKELSVGAA